jgi:queuine/archaeosine tRNA-ribosyltransferase
MEENEAQYIPALAGALPSSFYRMDDVKIEKKYLKGYKSYPEKPKSLRFFSKEENPLFSLAEFHKDPIILVSAGSNFKSDRFSNQLNVGDETKVFIDSGGYQLLKGTIASEIYTDEVALKWSEENGDIFPILDRPTGSNEYTDTEAEEMSINSAKYYIENRSKSGTQILNVLQGKTRAAKEAWYKKISDFKFDGWACGGIKTGSEAEYKQEAVFASALLCLYQFGELEKENVKRLHLFGVSSPDFVIYFNIIQNIFNKQGIDVKLTFDTTSFSMSGKFGHYWTGLSKGYGITGIKFPKNIDYKPSKSFRLPCVWSCPVCEGLEDVEGALMEYKKVKEKSEDAEADKWVFTNQKTSSQLSFLITLHNLYGMLQIEKNIKNVVYSDCSSIYQQVFGEKIANNIHKLKNIFDKTNTKTNTETEIEEIFTGATLPI